MHMQVGDMARPPLPLDRARCIEIADTCTQFNVRKAARAIGQIFDEALRPSGLRGTQFNLLIALSVLERATVARLAEALQLDPTTLTRNLAPLERDGLVESERGPTGTDAGRPNSPGWRGRCVPGEAHESWLRDIVNAYGIGRPRGARYS